MSVDLLSLSPEAARAALGEWLATRGEPAYRLRQVLPRLWERPVARWADATDLAAPLRAALDDAFPLRGLTLSTHQVSSDGTEKFLWTLDDGEAIESVLIPEGKRRTLCISSQAGCALGCVFCATGRMGFRRNLSAGEIAAQVREIVIRDGTKKPTNIVFMGMGEPLLNWDAVDTTLTILNTPPPRASASARGTSRCPRWGSFRISRSSRSARSSSASRSRSTRRRRRCGAS